MAQANDTAINCINKGSPYLHSHANRGDANLSGSAYWNTSEQIHVAQVTAIQSHKHSPTPELAPTTSMAKSGQ